MANGKLNAIIRFLRTAVRRFVGGWSLERKSLLFLGFALLLPIGLSFWFVLQFLADRLVMQTTRQKARDYARDAVAWHHVEKLGSEFVFPGDGTATLFSSDVYEILREKFVENNSYSAAEYMMLLEEEQYSNFNISFTPDRDRELTILRKLEELFREQLKKLKDAETRVLLDYQRRKGEEEIALALTEDEREELFAADADMVNIRRSLDLLYREEGPYLPQGKELDRLIASGIAKTVPEDGWYVYYHAINFTHPLCLECHPKYKNTTKPNIPTVPFRAVRVMIPYAETQVASTPALAVMIAIAMVTIAMTLFVVHWVFRRLVLEPMRHLQSVSDAISRGNTDLRANLDTGDEFSELSEAFNRMLRKVTDDQESLQSLNQELDVKVDELAQANLSLFEANRLKSDFLANMSHELRTPLNSIIGFSDVLHDIDALTDKQRRYANNIQSSGKVLLDMINEILDLAKIEAGKMQVAASSFDLKDLVSSQCDVMRPLVDEKNVDLQTHFEGDNFELFQDRPKLQQILTNLLSNAIKFTPDGGMIHVRARLHDEGLSMPMFEIEVADTGVGIPESDFEIIFQKFRQSNAVLENDGLTRQYAGTGLGLSIVRELCKLLGGEIHLRSQLGTGSTFTVKMAAFLDAGELPASEKGVL